MHGGKGRERTHLADATDVLIARLLVEPEVLVEPEADVVPVEPVRELVEVQEVLLERTSDRRLHPAAPTCPPRNWHDAHDDIRGLYKRHEAEEEEEEEEEGNVSCCARGMLMLIRTHLPARAQPCEPDRDPLLGEQRRALLRVHRACNVRSISVRPRTPLVRVLVASPRGTHLGGK